MSFNARAVSTHNTTEYVGTRVVHITTYVCTYVHCIYVLYIQSHYDSCIIETCDVVRMCCTHMTSYVLYRHMTALLYRHDVVCTRSIKPNLLQYKYIVHLLQYKLQIYDVIVHRRSDYKQGYKGSELHQLHCTQEDTFTQLGLSV